MESIQEQDITCELAAERMKSLQETVVSKASALVEANKQLNEPKGPDGSIRAKYGIYADEMYGEIYNKKRVTVEQIADEIRESVCCCLEVKRQFFLLWSAYCCREFLKRIWPCIRSCYISFSPYMRGSGEFLGKAIKRSESAGA